MVSFALDFGISCADNDTMSKTQKLLEKLRNGTISASELRTLMKQLGWKLVRTKGSHEQWVGPQNEKFTLATHSKELKPYQIKEFRKLSE
jgi:predicted RNA binding protein YcfA (HicA-like mRNA interferase family)